MIDYSDYDFEALVDRITELYKDKPGFTDNFESTTSQTLIQLLADVNDHLFYMLERRTQESFLDTAMLDTSIRARASELGYRPRRVVSSTGTLELTLVDEDGNAVPAQGNIVIPKGTQVFSDGNEFTVSSDAEIETGNTSVQLSVKEGVAASSQYNFDTDPYLSDPTILIEEYENIEEFSLDVQDGSSEYFDVGGLENPNINVTSLSYAMSDDALYDIRFSNDGMRVLFGDGEFGKKPSGVVTLSWVESSGSEVSIPATGLSFTFESEFLTDDLNISPQNLYRYDMVNVTPIRGGSDFESTSEIAKNAPEFARTANRAVTSQDYEFWVMRSGIGDIADVSVYSEQDTDSLIYNMNNVFISYITGDQLALNVEQLQALRDFMDKYKTVTNHMVFNLAKQVELVLDVDFKRNQQLPIANEQLYQVVKTRIEEFFEIDRGSIGKEFQHSELIEYLQNQTFTFNRVTYPITDWVKVGIDAQFPISIPIDIYDVLIDIDGSYTFIDGDEWIIVINGDAFSVFVVAGDTKADLVERMRQEIFNNSNFLTSVESGDVLRIKSPFVDDTFTLDLTQGDLATFVTSDTIFLIPPSTLNNPSGDELILPGSVRIVDSNEDVLFEDDGNGTMVPVTSPNPSFGIDYVNSHLLSPTLGNGEYFIRYKQNEYQNFDANRRTVLVLSDFADGVSDPFLFSKLRLV